METVNPVILCGLGTIGSRVLEMLHTAGMPVVIIDNTIDATDPRVTGHRLIKGDFRDPHVLMQADLREARGVLIVTSDDLTNLAGALMIRSIHPDIRIVIRMFNQNLIGRLGKAIYNVTALSVSRLAAPLLALSAVTGDVLAAVPIHGRSQQIIHHVVSANSRFSGRPLRELDDLEEIVVLSHTPVGQPARLLFDVDMQTILAPGDQLILMGEPLPMRRLLNAGKEEPLDVLWGDVVHRFGRIIWKTFSEMDLAVKVCTLTLLGVVLFSMLVYHYGLNHDWADSLYRTISVIATGESLGGDQYEGWGKVFVSFLHLMGTALVAAFTAIVTNYLLQARLGGALEIRRIPDRGHIVVCGLGNIGYRVVEELRRMNEPVVVIEQNIANPFIATCRRQGVAVVLGDAAVAEVLKQARIETARAVIVATSSDLLNLEIALIIADMNATQRVVVRTSDPTLADLVRRSASVKLALAPGDLAAPAFLAGLIGDRVHGMFMIGGKMLSIMDLVVPEGVSPLQNQSVRVLAVDYHFVPLALTRRNGEPAPLTSESRLAAGDRLTLIALLPDMERLVQRVPVPMNWSVEVLQFPVPARDELLLRLRALRNLGAAEAEVVLAQLPCVLATGITRGKAEELRALMLRERIQVRLVEHPTS